MKRIQKILCTFFAVLAVVFALPTAGAVSDNTAQSLPLDLARRRYARLHAERAAGRSSCDLVQGQLLPAGSYRW